MKTLFAIALLLAAGTASAVCTDTVVLIQPGAPTLQWSGQLSPYTDRTTFAIEFCTETATPWNGSRLTYTYVPSGWTIVATTSPNGQRPQVFQGLHCGAYRSADSSLVVVDCGHPG